MSWRGACGKGQRDRGRRGKGERGEGKGRGGTCFKPTDSLSVAFVHLVVVYLADSSALSVDAMVLNNIFNSNYNYIIFDMTDLWQIPKERDWIEEH